MAIAADQVGRVAAVCGFAAMTAMVSAHAHFAVSAPRPTPEIQQVFGGVLLAWTASVGATAPVSSMEMSPC
jgi:hypothetical protein